MDKRVDSCKLYESEKNSVNLNTHTKPNVMRKHIVSLFCILLFPVLIFAQPKQYIDSLLNAMRSQEDTTKVLTISKIISYYGNQGIFDSADIYSSQMLKLSEKIGYQKGICVAYNTYGIPQMVNGQYQKALEYFFKSLSIAEKNNLDRDAMVANRNIAAVFILQDELKLAIPLLRKILAQVTLLKDSVRIFPVLTDIGFCYDGLGNKDSARYYYEAGIFLCNLMGTRQLPEAVAGSYYQARARVFEKTSQYYMDNGRHKEALGLLLSMWEEVKGSPDVYTQIAMLNSISQSYLKIGKMDSVLFFSTIMINLKEARDFPDGLKDAYSFRADALYSTGRYKEAYEDKVQAAIFKDSVYSTGKAKAIHELQTKYETGKKEDQIKTLNREKRSQRIILGGAIAAGLIILGLFLFAIRAKRLQKKLFQKEKEAQQAELEKKMFELQQTALRAQMNPHFIFNCLNSVQRYVITNDVTGVNMYVSTFASLIRQTLENSGKPMISLKEELQYLETYIKIEQMRSGEGFDYEIKVDDNIDTDDIYIPNMIIQPFVENSIKHGLKGGREARSKLRLAVSQEKELVFIVEDNGTGIKNNNDLHDIQENDHESMGSSITEKRIALYNNSHEEKIGLQVVDRSDGGIHETGTKIILRFPLCN